MASRDGTNAPRRPVVNVSTASLRTESRSLLPSPVVATRKSDPPRRPATSTAGRGRYAKSSTSVARPATQGSSPSAARRRAAAAPSASSRYAPRTAGNGTAAGTAGTVVTSLPFGSTGVFGGQSASVGRMPAPGAVTVTAASTGAGAAAPSSSPPPLELELATALSLRVRSLCASARHVSQESLPAAADAALARELAAAFREAVDLSASARRVGSRAAAARCQAAASTVFDALTQAFSAPSACVPRVDMCAVCMWGYFLCSRLSMLLCAACVGAARALPTPLARSC